MKSHRHIVILLGALALPGCAYYDSQRYLHALKTDPDCTYQGKPAEYSTPPKCGPKSYGGSMISVIRVGPNTYSVGTIK
jgi:hypothetical protein